jgi:hypothetical protein
MREMVSVVDDGDGTNETNLIYFRSVAVVFVRMSGDGLKTRSSIVMVKTVQLPCIKHAMVS